MLSHEEQLNEEEEYFYFTLLLRECHDIFLEWQLKTDISAHFK